MPITNSTHCIKRTSIDIKTPRFLLFFRCPEGMSQLQTAFSSNDIPCFFVSVNVNL